MHITTITVAAEGWKVGGAECSCIAGTCTVREACSPSRGVWGRALTPQEIFEK